MYFTALLAFILPLILAIAGPVVLAQTDHQACLRACFHEKPACPRNMDPLHIGDCWTCCLHERNLPEGVTADRDGHGSLDDERMFLYGPRFTR
ncbi:hypothetical protein BDW62DRAFT_201785 [Aspergillus aurantiobrunneus]